MITTDQLKVDYYKETYIISDNKFVPVKYYHYSVPLKKPAELKGNIVRLIVFPSEKLIYIRFDWFIPGISDANKVYPIESETKKNKNYFINNIYKYIYNKYKDYNINLWDKFDIPNPAIRHIIRDT